MPDAPPPIAIRASDNPEQAFEQAFTEYSDAIFRHCYFHMYNRERAREIMQEAYMKTWEYISQGKDIDNVRAFLYRVATNLVYNEGRRKPVASLDELQEAGFDPGEDDPVLQKDIVERERVIAILREIDEPYRAVISMRFIEELSPSEIAEILDETPNAISVRINRGLKQLRSKLPHG